MDQLQCNLVTVNRLNPKILRLNLKRSANIVTGLPLDDGSLDSSSVLLEGLSYIGVAKGFDQSLVRPGMPRIGSDRDTPSSSPDMGTPFTATELGTSSNSSSEPSNSPYPDAPYVSSELETAAESRLADILASSTPDASERPRGYPASESDNDDASPSRLEPFFSDEKFSSRRTGATHAPDFSRVRTRTPSRGNV